MGSQNKSIIDGLAQMTKRNISEGNLRALSDSTINVRERGDSSFAGHMARPSNETRPLFYTGSLLRSIKPNEDGIEMLDYGIEHHEGFTTPSKNIGAGANKSVPARNFIAGAGGSKEDMKGLERIQNDLVKKMNRAMLKTSK